MSTTRKILQLLEHYHSYEQKTGNAGLLGFAQWLMQKYSLQVQAVPDPAESLDNMRMALYLSMRVTKHMRQTYKDLMQNNGLTSIDELVMLAVLEQKAPISKSELYRDTLLEVPTGSQMLRRLIDKGLVIELEDPNDRRQKQVQLTDTGRQVRQTVFDGSAPALGQSVAALSTKELHQLVTLLSKLEHWFVVANQ